MRISDIFDIALPVVQIVETVGSAAGASGQQKHQQAVQLLAERINARLDLPPFVEENTDEALGMIIDGAVWGLNSLLGREWEQKTPMQNIAKQADPALLESLKGRLGRG